jgi:hypothetical protein
MARRKENGSNGGMAANGGENGSNVEISAEMESSENQAKWRRKAM